MNETVFVISSALLWVVVLFNLLLTLVLVRRVTAAQTQQQSGFVEWLRPGERAPDFTAENLDGETITLTTYAGRSVVFLFMSHTCKPCRDHLPEYEVLSDLARQAGTVFVFVFFATVAATRDFLVEFPVTSPVIVAPPDENPFRDNYKIFSTPSYCLVDTQGRIHSCDHPDAAFGAWKEVTESWRTGASAEVPPELEEATDGVT